MTSPIYFRGNRAQAVQVARRLKDILTGRASDPQGIARGVFMAIGLAALSDIKDDFVRKANGETGEDGNKWDDLAPATKAYGRRFGPGEQAALKAAAGLGKKHRHAPGEKKGLLTANQQKLWNRIFATRLQRFLLSMPPADAKARAAQIAWAEVKRMGGKTKLSVYGSRKVQILRDTGVLLNSLSPGELTGDSYSKPSGPGGDDQIFRTIQNGIIVGTTVPYAGAQNKTRPFLPKDPPQVWLDRWEKVAERAIAVAVRMIYSGAA